MLASKKFQRNIEDFVCEKCGTTVTGNGYTNHCPNCLWSKHVDNNPGDRLATCKGLMKPVSLEQKHGKYIIVHRCVKCGLIKRNKAAENDNFNALLELSTQHL